MEVDLKLIIPTIISAIAAIFSILTYKRNRRIENENYLFKSKMKCYSKILGEFNILINVLDGYVADYKSHLEAPEGWKEGEIDEIADDVDDVIRKFDDEITVNSLLIPKNIIEKLDIPCI